MQRVICYRLLESWMPVAASAAPEADAEGHPIRKEDQMEEGLKAGAFVLKVLERLARLDGFDKTDLGEQTDRHWANPSELAQRVQVASPVLLARLSGGNPPDIPPTGDPQGTPS